MAARKKVSIGLPTCGIPVYAPVESTAETEFDSEAPRTWRGLPLHALGERTVVLDGAEIVANVHVGAPVKTDAACVLVADGPAEISVAMRARTYRDSRTGDREATGQLEVDLHVAKLRAEDAVKFMASQAKRAEAMSNA